MAFQFPSEVPGWLTYVEGECLHRLAQGKTVLEIGSYAGRSTLCLAQSARRVLCVDPFDGRATDARRDTWTEFWSHVKAAGFEGRVLAERGTSAAVLPHMKGQFAVDLVFVDGDHSYEAVHQDVKLALPLLTAGGVIAFHDYRSFDGEHDGRWDPGVTRCVDELRNCGWTLVERAGTVAVLKPPADAVVPAVGRLVAMAMPRGDSAIRNKDAAKAFYRASLKGMPRMELDGNETSLAIRCFNLSWCQALAARRDAGVTHYAMQHDDVCPDPGWLDVMVEELERTGADVLSAVVPIKNGTGVTSTAVGFDGDAWERRRLTMREVFQLPETFTLDDVPWRERDGVLLANTGLWVCRFDRPWVDRVCFGDRTRLEELADGTKTPLDISEDWDWSVQLHRLGASVAVTRKVPLYHGRKEFTTREPWGAWERDEGYFEYRRKKGLD